ncbi:hypothetical protein BJY01DRAFT_247852 [Aspergillus pseudoustus]|uniref:TauD/TfdA-like domain-containing protein n=1 Tax=Aspergillus pseudoustus TaxID=1810923 RepID=A0ABR4JY93_9EURO
MPRKQPKWKKQCGTCHQIGHISSQCTTLGALVGLLNERQNTRDYWKRQGSKKRKQPQKREEEEEEDYKSGSSSSSESSSSSSKSTSSMPGPSSKSTSSMPGPSSKSSSSKFGSSKSSPPKSSSSKSGSSKSGSSKSGSSKSGSSKSGSSKSGSSKSGLKEVHVNKKPKTTKSDSSSKSSLDPEASCFEPSGNEEPMLFASALPEFSWERWKNVAHQLFGDGTPIPEEYLAVLARITDEIRVLHKWQDGDVLVYDNIIAQHGREPWEGEQGDRVVLASLFDGERVPGAYGFEPWAQVVQALDG